jgi:hypothetical protein
MTMFPPYPYDLKWQFGQHGLERMPILSRDIYSRPSQVRIE